MAVPQATRDALGGGCLATRGAIGGGCLATRGAIGTNILHLLLLLERQAPAEARGQDKLLTAFNQFVGSRRTRLFAIAQRLPP